MKLMHWQAALCPLAVLLLCGWPAEAQSIQVYTLGSPVSGQPSQLVAGTAGPPAGSGAGFDAIAELQADSKITPPDPNVAVSPVIVATGERYVVESVNKGLRTFRTDGAPASGYTPFADPITGFFSKSTVSIFDPRLVFDPYVQRFLLIALERDKPNNKGYIHLAISETADPLGAWSVFKTAVPAPYHPDYPSLAVDRQAIYLGVNLFLGDPSATAPPDALLYRAIGKSALLSTTNPQITTMVDLVETTSTPQYHWSMRAAQPYGLPLNAPAVGLFLGTFRQKNDTPPLTVFPKLRAVKMLHPLDASLVSLTAFDVPVPGYTEPSQDGPQKCATTGQTLDVSSGQIQNAVWRDGDLYAAHTVPVAGVNTARWYQIRTGPPDAPVTWSQLVQDGDVRGDLPSQHTYLPTVGVDLQGSLVIAYAQSSATTPVSFRIAARAACDAHSTTQYRSIVKEVDICYKDSTGAALPYRWGDYWGVAVDPASPPLLWAVGEYVKAEKRWGTWIVPIEIIPECPTCACSW